MVEAALRRGRRRSAGRRSAGRMVAAAIEYAAMGWPVCAGAYPPDRPHRHGEAQRSCSCDRIGCPAPGAHPMSAAWQVQASADPHLVSRWWAQWPEANVILVTGRVFDVLDVPAAVAPPALDRMERSDVRPGPVAMSAGDRALFFVATRGAPTDEDEWWSCHLDCEPEVIADAAGLRWHCRDSYVLAPPSRYAAGRTAYWLREPGPGALPDGLRLLPFLADTCEELRC